MKPWKVKHSHVAFDGSPYVRLLEQIVSTAKAKKLLLGTKLSAKISLQSSL